jgi:aspartyl-tRNA(Asn)/glutamyl-tRNA(Gln) amidotransferase subunit A
MHDATAIAGLVLRREASAAEIARDHLERLGERDREIGSVWLVTEERALAEAEAVDRALERGEDPGPLAGVPVGWKDLIDTAGSRTTYGSAIWRDHVPAIDADVVASVSVAGGVTIGKLATHELAWGTTTDNPFFGTCHNPHDTSRVPGGSSGGSAAALAAGIVALAPGTDTGGSIRCPASCCGVVGLKPTYGRVSLAGIHPLCQSLDHCGPMARSVRDCALALEVLAGPSPRDPRTPAVPVERYRDALGAGVAGMTIGVAERGFFEHTAPDVAAPVRAAVEALREAGATVIEFDLGWPPDDDFLNGRFYMAEMAATLADYWPERAADLGPEPNRDLRAAEAMSGVEQARIDLNRLAWCAELEQRTREAGVDLIASPTQPCTPPPIGTTALPFAGRDAVDISAVMCSLTEVFDVNGWPAISVPCGTDAAGMPAGLQLAALPWREADCLAAAAVLQD